MTQPQIMTRSSAKVAPVVTEEAGAEDEAERDALAKRLESAKAAGKLLRWRVSGTAGVLGGLCLSTALVVSVSLYDKYSLLYFALTSLGTPGSMLMPARAQLTVTRSAVPNLTCRVIYRRDAHAARTTPDRRARDPLRQPLCRGRRVLRCGLRAAIRRRCAQRRTRRGRVPKPARERRR